MNTKETNVGTLERVIRVVGGGAVAVISLVLLLGGSSFLGSALAVAGIALGLDFFYTGLTGYCPLYSKLGRSTARRQAGAVHTHGKRAA